MYDQRQNQAIDSKVLENQQKAAQLSEQINRQRAAQISQQKPKNVRAGGSVSLSSSGNNVAPAKAPAKKRRAGVAA